LQAVLNFFQVILCEQAVIHFHFNTVRRIESKDGGARVFLGDNQPVVAEGGFVEIIIAVVEPCVENNE
jgi:hypothetical protein